MFQKLSYFNLIFVMVYLLVYLKNGTFNSVSGILAIIVFSWLALRSEQLENHRWSFWHYLTGIWSLCFIGTLVYGNIHIILPAIEYEFISNDTLLLLAMSFTLIISVGIHLIWYFRKSR